MSDARKTVGGLEATGERLVPERQRGELVHAEHVARYRFAARLAEGARVLDAASGEGYGTAILAAAGADSVMGVEIDLNVVAHARETYGLPFEAADVADLPFEDGSFGLVVSFETIEHVSDARAVLSEFRRVLSDEGTLVISTPNKHEYLVDNEFHTREYTHEEFVELLSDFFPSVQILLQHNWLVSTVSDEGFAGEGSGEEPQELELYKLVGIEPGAELYSIALCGAAPRDVPTPVAARAGTDEAHILARGLRSAEETAERWHREYVAAEETARNWHEEYRKAEESARGWHAEYDTAKSLAQKLHRELEIMRNSLSWRITEPLRRVMARVRGGRG